MFPVFVVRDVTITFGALAVLLDVLGFAPFHVDVVTAFEKLSCKKDQPKPSFVHYEVLQISKIKSPTVTYVA